MFQRTTALLLCVSAAVLGSCATSSHESTVATSVPPLIALPTLADQEPRDYPGVHNAVAYREGFISGSAPEGNAGFETLTAMGVKTIISVDGAVPDVDMAEARGMRYIHLPIGYNGFNDARRLELSRATRDAIADGPVYIHCHHGKHRSAGAAAAIAVTLGWDAPDDSVARMKVSGTSPKYTGLYACAANADIVSMGVLDAVPADFPSTWKPSSFVHGMVEIDKAFEHLKLIERAGWIVPPDHPDLVPVAEAGRLADLHRDLIASDDSTRRTPEFNTLMQDGHDASQRLEDLLLEAAPSPTALSAQMTLILASCTDCHATYRNDPSAP